MALKRVGILTGGGDCSGLNAVIRAVTRAAVIGHKAEVVGIEGGFDGLLTGHTQELTVRSTRDILTLGGTILGTTNKGNPFEYRELLSDGTIHVSDRSDAVSALRLMALALPFVLLTSGARGILEARFAFGLLNAIRIPLGLVTFLGSAVGFFYRGLDADDRLRGRVALGFAAGIAVGFVSLVIGLARA